LAAVAACGFAPPPQPAATRSTAAVRAAHRVVVILEL